MVKVFLGGTCADTKWREELIKLLKIDFFNPVVDDWTPECQEDEIRQRENCDYVLYVITPQMQGVYSIAEVVDDSNKRPEKCIFCVLRKYDDKYFSKGELRSLKAVEDMVSNNGAKVFNSLPAIACYLNNYNKEV